MKNLIHTGGRIYFAHVDKVIEDVSTYTDLCIVLGDNRP